jgi:hypothetical protein
MPTTGAMNKKYISAIAYMDQREIEKSVVDIQNEDDFLDFFIVSQRYEKSSMFDYHNFVNEALFLVLVINDATVTGSGTATVSFTLSTGTSGYVRLWDTVITPLGKQAIVTALTPGAQDDITIKSVDGSTLTIADTNKLAVISNAQVEKSGAQESRRYSWTKYFNKIQIFRESDEITDVQKASKVEVNFRGQPYVMLVQHAQKMQSLRGQIAAQCLAGQMSSTSFSDASPAIANAAGHTFQTTRGLHNYIIDQGGIQDTVTTPGTVVLADIKDLVTQFVANKCPTNYIMWHGVLTGAHYDDFLKNLGSAGLTSVRMIINGREVDMMVEKWQYAGFIFQKKRLPIIDHPQLFNFTGASNIYKHVYFIPTDNIKTQLAGVLPRIRMRYIEQPLEGGTGDSIYKEVNQGLLAPVPVGRDANWTTDWITYQGLEILGAQHFAKQIVAA